MDGPSRVVPVEAGDVVFVHHHGLPFWVGSQAKVSEFQKLQLLGHKGTHLVDTLPVARFRKGMNIHRVESLILETDVASLIELV